jgi:hypothetical protein
MTDVKLTLEAQYKKVAHEIHRLKEPAYITHQVKDAVHLPLVHSDSWLYLKGHLQNLFPRRPDRPRLSPLRLDRTEVSLLIVSYLSEPVVRLKIFDPHSKTVFSWPLNIENNLRLFLAVRHSIVKIP